MTFDSVRGILLDIEGTTSSIKYVFDVLFPFARKELRTFLSAHWNEPAVARARELILPGASSLGAIVDEALRLMDADAKTTGLKELQGLIWQEGYAAGKLRSHVYPDVVPALERWSRRGIDIRIYSSGSIAAQKVFFAHTDAGDLSRFLKGNYDTTTGPKKESRSYAAIAEDMNLPVEQILFMSDVVAELDAAHAAKMQTVLVIRPGNAPVVSEHGHGEVRSFDDAGVH